MERTSFVKTVSVVIFFFFFFVICGRWRSDCHRCFTSSSSINMECWTCTTSHGHQKFVDCIKLVWELRVLERMESGHYVNVPNDGRHRENDSPGQVMFNEYIILKISEHYSPFWNASIYFHIQVWVYVIQRTKICFLCLFYWKIFFDNAPSSDEFSYFQMSKTLHSTIQ